jgi:hypothetical protein
MAAHPLVATALAVGVALLIALALGLVEMRETWLL